MPTAPFKNEDGSWSHPALPGLSFRLKREALAAAEATTAGSTERISIGIDQAHAGQTRPAEDVFEELHIDPFDIPTPPLYIPRF